MSNASFRQLIVWQRAIDLTFAVYAAMEQFSKDELFGLTSQLRRAAVSVPSNIAEGPGRATKGEFRHFLGVALGSLAELQTQPIIARGLSLADQESLSRCETLSADVSRTLAPLIQSLNKTPGTPNIKP